MPYSALFFDLLVLFYEAHKGSLCNVSHREIKECIILHKRDIRNRLHLEQCGEVGLIVNVNLAEFYVGILLGKSLYYGCK